MFWGKREGRRKRKAWEKTVYLEGNGCWRTILDAWKNVGFAGIACGCFSGLGKVRQRAKRREELFRASAWRGPLFILPFWAEGDRRVSHATRRHPAGQPRKGAIAAGKEGLAIGINYSEWRGLCLPFSPLFLKGAREGKNSTPTTGCPLRFWKASAFQVTNLTSLHSHRPPNSLLPPPLECSGVLLSYGDQGVFVLWSFITSRCACILTEERDMKLIQLFY